MEKFTKVFCVLILVYFLAACGRSEAGITSQTNTISVTPISNSNNNSNSQINVSPSVNKFPTPAVPTTQSPIGKYDFKNHAYPLPRGWQDETKEITLQNGKAPVSTEEDHLKIGATYVNTGFGDVTGDQEDEAFVVLKIETGGSALPQLVYVFEWKGGKPEIIWYFRTGDRADGGLKDLRAENGMLVVELYGQDRYIFGDVETLKIVGDEEQLCCPKFFTRNKYKLTGGRFILQGKRETYSINDPNSPPIENMGDKKLEEVKQHR